MNIAWDTQALELFWHFISERQRAYVRRALKHAPPWSTDPIVQGTHFTNVYRELDPGTRWLTDNVLAQPSFSPSEAAFVAMAYRLFGTEEVFEYLGVSEGEPRFLPHDFDEVWLREALEDRMSKGLVTFTPAYMVSNYGRSESKATVIADILNRAAENWPRVWGMVRDAQGRRDVHYALTTVYGVGGFVAFQTMVDLCYPVAKMGGNRILPFSNNGWVVAGPGALKGLGILAPGLKLANGADDKAIADLVKMQYIPLQQRRMRWLLDLKNKPILIDRSNMQNCLCEFSKYMRLREQVGSGKGGRKRGFNADAAIDRDSRHDEDYHFLAGMAVQADIEDLVL